MKCISHLNQAKPIDKSDIVPFPTSRESHLREEFIFLLHEVQALERGVSSSYGSLRPLEEVGRLRVGSLAVAADVKQRLSVKGSAHTRTYYVHSLAADSRP